MSIRVLIADDQTVVREGLTLLVGLIDGLEVVGTAADGDEAISMSATLHPDVVLLDLKMPRCGGLEALPRLRSQVPSPQVVVLTTYADDESVLTALRAGARGYLTKDATGEEIAAAVRDAAAGRTRLDSTVQDRLVAIVASGQPPSQPDLTPRENEVLTLIAEGSSNRAIARRLVVSEATVKTHVNNIFAKLGVNDRAAAVAYVYKAQRHDEQPPYP